jgi:leader peptidase (prepilin peptidase)/N-methyltransferase
MGQGDMKLLALLGAWLGPLSLIPLVLLASTSGALVGIWRLKVRQDLALDEPMAFGPYLIFAAFVLLFWGPQFALQFLGLRA